MPSEWELNLISKQAETFALFQSEFRRFLETFQTVRTDFTSQIMAVRTQLDILDNQLDRLILDAVGSSVAEMKKDLAECKAKISSVENCLQRADGLQSVLKNSMDDLLENIDGCIDDKLDKLKDMNEVKYWRFAGIAAVVLQIVFGIILIWYKK